MLLRVIVPCAIIAFVLWLTLRATFEAAEREALRRRMDKFNDWVKTFNTMTPEEQRVATTHMMRIIQEGHRGGYHGPWE